MHKHKPTHMKIFFDYLVEQPRINVRGEWEHVPRIGNASARLLRGRSQNNGAVSFHTRAKDVYELQH
jgi:hypothetical protein